MADSLSPQTSLKWGDSFDLLSDERKNELRGRLNDWDPMTPTYGHGQSGPFAGEHLNGLEVFWLAACALARKDGDPTIAGTTLTDLSQFWPTRFTKLNLSEANLSEANLSGAILFGADLFMTNLHRAILSRADLSEAYLFQADLRTCLVEPRSGNMIYTPRHEYYLSKQSLRYRVGLSPTSPAAPITA